MSPADQTLPVGLCGVLRMTSRVRGLSAPAKRCQSGRKSGPASGTCTARPPASSMPGS